jgi:hypothetical protein
MAGSAADGISPSAGIINPSNNMMNAEASGLSAASVDIKSGIVSSRVCTIDRFLYSRSLCKALSAKVLRRLLIN